MNEMEDIVTQRMHEENAAFPLSQSQQNIWDLEKAYSGTSINHITTSVRIQGQFRLDLLQKSIRLLLESDSSLRTRIEMREGKLVQYIVPMEEEAVPVFDFSLSGARATVLEPRRSSCCGTMSSSELPYKAKEPRRVPGLS